MLRYSAIFTIFAFCHFHPGISQKTNNYTKYYIKMTTAEITFKINGKLHRADGRYGPDFTLNEYIRTVANLRGTKAMCLEGGCGVCIVNVRLALPPTNEVKSFAVNSCLVSILSCHDWEVTTIEGIGNKKTGYHAIQKRLASFNGTQCGYCSPGFVMSMYSLYESRNQKLSSVDIENSFASNICRCTGYRPIADACKTFAQDADESLLKQVYDLEDLDVQKSCSIKCTKKCTNVHCKNINNEFHNETPWCIIENGNNRMFTIESQSFKWHKVYNLEDVFKVMKNDNNYKLIAGNTGQGVIPVKEYPSTIIDIFNVSELKEYLIDVNLILGAGISLAELMEVFLKISSENNDFSYLKEFYNHIDLIAHIPVRNIGTIGGNLMLKHTDNGFQSDIFLIFESVGGMITIGHLLIAAESVINKEIITLPEFLRTDMAGKIILNVILPPLSQCCSVKTFKIMPRAQNTHAIINAGFVLKFHHNSHLLEEATIVFGGISKKFIHAVKTETILVGRDPYSNETLQLALNTLKEELDPEENKPQPSAPYRKMLALCLYYKAILHLCPDEKINPVNRSGGETIKRQSSKGFQTFDTDKSIWPLNQPIPKIEATIQFSGEAVFSNDLPSMSNEVFGAFVTADVNVGSIISGFDTTDAFKIPGVTGFYTAKDIPGDNTFTPLNVPNMSDQEEILCSGKVKFFGQPTAIIVANRDKTAQDAAKLVKIIYSFTNTNKPLLTIDDIFKSAEISKRVINNEVIEPSEVGNETKHVLNGELKLKGQYHFYMEPQTTVTIPSEDGLQVHASTQWLGLTNIAVAQCLNIPINEVNVKVRRVGGGYGGKISRSSQIACAAALVSHLQGNPCRFILPLATNMKSIGKRLPINSNFEVGVNDDGMIQYLKIMFYQDCGYSFNEIIAERTVVHLYSCYDPKRWRIEGNSVVTDNPSNTYCRSPSSAEAIAMIENIMEYIAYNLKKDPLEVRLLNMAKDDNLIPEMIKQLKMDCDYDSRINKVKLFNTQNRWRKRALKMLPIAFEIYYFGNFNSLISIFHGDGSVIIHHGGISMGQGLNTKVAQVCAYKFGIPVEKISVKESSSFISPNSMVTGASIGSECVAFATIKACDIILARLAPIKATGTFSWEQLITKAYENGVDLQASYMYSGNDNLKPYNVFAVCALEIELDLLTGNHDVRRLDLLEDTGRSLSPVIDVGQIEGAFMMGLGYWTSENLVYDESSGELLTNGTWTYKPPGMKDIPADMRIYFQRNAGNEFGVLQSKATGEPAFCLATVILHAFREAIRSGRMDAGYPDQWVEIGIPCNVENIFMALDHKIEHFLLI